MNFGTVQWQNSSFRGKKRGAGMTRVEEFEGGGLAITRAYDWEA